MKHLPILRVESLTIANGAAASSSVDMELYTLQGIEFPAALTGASITLQVSQDNTNFVTVHNGASDVTIAKQNGKLVLLGKSDFATYFISHEGLGRYLRVVSASNEGAARTIKVYLTPRAR